MEYPFALLTPPEMNTAKFNSALSWKNGLFFNHVNQIPSRSCSIPWKCIPLHLGKNVNLSLGSIRPQVIWPCLPLFSLIRYYCLLCSFHTGLLALSRTHQAHFCLRTFAMLFCPPHTHFSQIFTYSLSSFKSLLKCHLLKAFHSHPT